MPARNSLLATAGAVQVRDFNSQTGKIFEGAAEDCSQICVLSISPNAEDHALLRGILGSLPWEVLAVANCKQAIKRLNREPVSLVFCDSVLEDGTWKDILSHIRKDIHPPLLIVASRLADELLWAEVLNLGGYDVLAKPLNPKEVRHVFATASLWLTSLAAPRRTVAAG